jgi:hypothetical protein
MDGYCAAARLHLRRLGATDGALGLDDASSFWVAAERPSPSRFHAKTGL